MNKFPIIEPDLATLLDLKISDLEKRINCHKVGRIESFDNSKQTAEVSLSFKIDFGGKVRDITQLVDVPIFVLGSGDKCFTFPIRKGDTCLVLFNDFDIDNWFSTGNVVVPSSTRTHDLSDGLALVGFRNRTNPVSSYDSSDVQVRNDSSIISVGEKILVKNETTDLKAVLQSIVTALNSLDSVKTGSSASAAITLASNAINNLLKS